MDVYNNLSVESVSVLHRRGRTEQQIGDFAHLLQKANERMRDDVSAKQVLSEMSEENLSLVQHTAGLADPINVNSLSNEAAINLLSQPDHSDMVDLNNDGLVEVGAAKLITFPPVNAPASVKRAWNESVKGLAEQDKMMLQLQMHTAVYGVHIEGMDSKVPLSPEKQWSEEGVSGLFDTLKSALAFAVSFDGWTEANQMKRDFYQRFEQALS